MIGIARIIENDLFGIAARLKSIDDSYFIVRNYRYKRFEVHSTAQRGGSLALVLPYDELDERTVTHVLSTRIQRRKALIAEIERENERLDRLRLERRLKQAEKDVEELYGKL